MKAPSFFRVIEDHYGAGLRWSPYLHPFLFTLLIAGVLSGFSAAPAFADPVDEEGPVLLYAGYLIVTCPGAPPPPTSPEIQVVFDEALDPVTATDVLNYTFFETENPAFSIEVVEAEYWPEWNPHEIYLLLADIPPAVTFTLAVSGVQDIEGNVMEPGQFAVIEIFVDDVPPSVGALPILWPNVPNPFNPQTTITFELGRDERAAVGVYGLSGRHVATLASRRFTAGIHSLPWHGRDSRGRAMPSGTYVVRLETASGVEAGLVTLVR